MKLLAPPELSDAATALQDALRREIQMHRELAPSLKGGDMSIDDGLAFNSCDDITPECLDGIAAQLSSTMLVFGTLRLVEGQEAELTLRWYAAGSGFRRQLSERFSSAEALSEQSAALAQRLIQGETGKLVVTSNEAGAALLLNGQQIGLTPFDGAVPVGQHMIGVQREGFLSTGQVVVTIERDGETTLQLDLISQSLLQGEAETHPLILAGWPILGVGVAAIAGGAVTWSLFSSTQEEFDVIFKGGRIPDSDELLEAERLSDRADTLSAATYALMYAGGALAVTGAALAVVGYVVQDSEGEVEAEAAILPGGGAVQVRWRW